MTLVTSNGLHCESPVDSSLDYYQWCCVQEARLGPALVSLLHCGLAGPGRGLASCWDEDLVLSLIDTAAYHWLTGVADL